MLEDRFSWLDDLPDMRIDGVQGVEGVQPQKTGTFQRTPDNDEQCAGVHGNTGEHLRTPRGVPEQAPKIRACTPGTPRTPENDDLDSVEAIRRGLDLLRSRSCPKLTRIGAWGIVVGDALRLLEDGWVEKALGLGWNALDLFGVGPRDSRQFAGLAVWLDCRRVTLLDADGAHAGPWCRGFMGPGLGRYRRGKTTGAVPLWDFGR